LGAEPVAIASGFEPRDSYNWLLGMIEVGIVPEGWRQGFRVAQKGVKSALGTWQVASRNWSTSTRWTGCSLSWPELQPIRKEPAGIGRRSGRSPSDCGRSFVTSTSSNRLMPEFTIALIAAVNRCATQNRGLRLRFYSPGRGGWRRFRRRPLLDKIGCSEG
jgi:hypothetical protein